MTANAVADGTKQKVERRRRRPEDCILGRIARKYGDLFRRVVEGSVDPERTMTLMQWAMDNPPLPQEDWTSQTYVLEWCWSWDKRHTERVTYGVERCDYIDGICFDHILDPAIPEEIRECLQKKLRELYNQQDHGTMGGRLSRLYLVLGTDYFGYADWIGPNGTVQDDIVDLHLSLKPICDFDKDGNPVPCVIERS